jgi:long-chain acyl-CoA synthetase
MSLAYDAKSTKLEAKLPAVERVPAPWLSHYTACVPTHLDYPDEPVWWLLDRAAAQFPQRTAIRYFRESVTYAELLERARRAATVFQSLGVRPGDRVGLLLPNIPEYLIAAYGVWMAGGLVVSLSPLSVSGEVDQLLHATDCKLVVALDLLVPLAAKGAHHPSHILTCSFAHRLPTAKRFLYHAACLKRRGFRNESQVATSDFMEELSRADPIARPIIADADAPAYILPTGGTTGSPKAVTLSHRNLLANALQLKAWCGNRTGRNTILAVIPFFHSYGLSTCVTSGVAMAATLVLYHRFEPLAVLDLIETERPNVFPAVPAMLHLLNQRLREHPGRWNVQSLMWVISGGAALPADTCHEFTAFTGAHVVEGYGLSECSPVTHAGPLDGTARIGTIGLPLPDTEARIVDAETGYTILDPGHVGELIVRGPQVMLGYWNNREATDLILRDGWLFTGDLGTCDEDGFFKIVDRKKDLIITSGFNVYPSDVEFVIKQFAGVTDAAVVGVPDPQRGEIVKAVVAISRKSKFERHGLERFLKQNLAHHKVPKIIEVIEGDLPRNFLGKVLKRKLREIREYASASDASSEQIEMRRMEAGEAYSPEPHVGNGTNN